MISERGNVLIALRELQYDLIIKCMLCCLSPTLFIIRLIKKEPKITFPNLGYQMWWILIIIKFKLVSTMLYPKYKTQISSSVFRPGTISFSLWYIKHEWFLRDIGGNSVYYSLSPSNTKWMSICLIEKCHFKTLSNYYIA